MPEFQSFFQRGREDNAKTPLEPGDDSLFNSLAMTRGKLDPKKLSGARSILGDAKVDYILAEIERERQQEIPKGHAPGSTAGKGASKNPSAESGPALPPLSKTQRVAAKNAANSASCPVPAAKKQPASVPPPPVRKISLAEKLAEIGISVETVRSLSKSAAPPPGPAKRVPPLPEALPAADAARQKRAAQQPPAHAPSVPEWLNEIIRNGLPPRTALITADANHALGTDLIVRITGESVGTQARERSLLDFNAIVRTSASLLNEISAMLAESTPNQERLARLIGDVETVLRSRPHAKTLISEFIELIRSGKISWTETK